MRGHGGNGSGGVAKSNGDRASRIMKYLDRAEELRAIAGAMKTEQARETLLSTALEYEHMASALQRRNQH